jgi:PAS domain S-box-containing protein
MLKCSWWSSCTRAAHWLRPTRRTRVGSAAARGARAVRDAARSARLLQVLADNSPDAIFAKDAEGRYILLNRAAAATLNTTADTVLGKDDTALMPTHAAAIRQRDVEIMQLDRPAMFEEELDTPRGRRVFLTTKGPLREAGPGHKPFGVFGIARDVTERVEARQLLEHSEQRYRLASAGGYVWDWDLENRRGEAQSSFWQRLGHEAPPDGGAFDKLVELTHPDDRPRLQAAVRAHLLHRAPYELEFRARHRSGQWRWFHTQGQAVWRADGRAHYMAGTTFDITARREAEESLRRARVELSELLRRLMDQERETTVRLAHSLHDQLGQVLCGARLHLDLVRTRAPQTEGLEHVSVLLDDAIAEVRRVLVDLRPPLLQEQGLATALDNEVRRDTHRNLTVDVRLHCRGTTTLARWPDRVEHAAFMVAREALTNALRHAQARAVVLHLAGDGTWLDLQVCDDGRGIADEERQSRPGHLGLVGMRERAASIGAALVVQRTSPGGTRVQLRWREREPVPGPAPAKVPPRA